MADGIIPHEQAPVPAAGAVMLERVRGCARVGLRPDGRGGARLAVLEQSGSARAFLPRVHAGPCEVVFLNTAGGLTGGDRLEYAVDLEAGAVAVATTQTAERAYASTGAEARLSLRMRLGAGAALDWLPQETILFDRARLTRDLQIDLAEDSRLLLAETLVIGRRAMGETVTALRCRDWREVRRGGRPVLIEPLDITAEALRAGPACLGGARAFATLALVAQGGEDAKPALQAVLAQFGPRDGLEAAVSAWDGKCVMRLAAPDALVLRQALTAALGRLRGCGPPRVWQT